jgi:hypothetical protein
MGFGIIITRVRARSNRSCFTSVLAERSQNRQYFQRRQAKPSPDCRRPGVWREHRLTEGLATFLLRPTRGPYDRSLLGCGGFDAAHHVQPINLAPPPTTPCASTRSTSGKTRHNRGDPGAAYTWARPSSHRRPCCRLGGSNQTARAHRWHGDARDRH